MFAFPYLLVFLLSGLWIIRCLLPRQTVLVRIWLGCCLGILLMMWLPFLTGLALRFTLTAHLVALLPLLALDTGCYFLRSRQPVRRWEDSDKKSALLLLCVALPQTATGGYLEWTHNLRPAADGSLHVGQSTYGDLNLHLSIITSLRNAALPADYSIFPGETLSYPFLMDSFSTSFMLLGASLRLAVLFPSILMMALTFSGYVLLAVRILRRRGVAALAALLFFLNGGLGFLYIFDLQGVSLGSDSANQLQMGTGFLSRLQNVLEGWYQAPTNHREFTTYNLRWSNVICDMLVPQRTILGGWCQLLPCMYLLYDALCGKNDAPCLPGCDRRYDLRQTALLGVWSDGLVLLHTHSYLALGLMSAGFMAYDLFHARGQRKACLLRYLLYGGLSVALALPQLLRWTFSQTAGSDHFLSFHFNWVNNSYSQGMRDFYLWFYVKNVGLPFLFLLLSLLEKNPKRRFLAAGAFTVFLAAELIQFQPNEYDNNKLFYVWYMLGAMLAADYMAALFRKLQGFRSRYALAGLTLVFCFASAGLTVAREWVSDYQLFSAQDVDCAAYVEENTPEHAVFMSYTQHINPVSALAGRTTVCGPDLWLYYHGFSTDARHSDIAAFYADPVGRKDILEKYGVSYVYLSSYERANLNVDTAALDANYPCVYESAYGDIRIYQVTAP